MGEGGRGVSVREMQCERLDWLLLALKMEGDYYPRNAHHLEDAGKGKKMDFTPGPTKTSFSTQ